jgi:hypothetical protein
MYYGIWLIQERGVQKTKDRNLRTEVGCKVVGPVQYEHRTYYLAYHNQVPSAGNPQRLYSTPGSAVASGTAQRGDRGRHQEDRRKQTGGSEQAAKPRTQHSSLVRSRAAADMRTRAGSVLRYTLQRSRYCMNILQCAVLLIYSSSREGRRREERRREGGARDRGKG